MNGTWYYFGHDNISADRMGKKDDGNWYYMGS
ncbi:hypothetical protein [Hungatella sp.]